MPVPVSTRLTAAVIVTVLLLLLLTQPAASASNAALSRRQTTTNHTTNHTTGHWITAWTAMPQLTEPANLPPPPFNATPAIFANTTIRQTIRLTGTPAGTTRLRLRLSNAFGLTPLTLSALTLAQPLPLTTNSTGAGSPAIDPSTLQTVTFAGDGNFSIPPGALAVSDALEFPLEASDSADLSISLYLQTGQTGNAITSHPGSRTTSWLAFGDHTASPTLAGEEEAAAASVAHWYFLSAIEAWAPNPSSAATLAIIGDSITDGRGSTTDANNRWPDLLASRLRSLDSTVAIANQAAGGNRVLADGLGPSALARFDRDVLAQAGVRWALVFEGVNDLGAAAATADAQAAVGDALVAAYKQFVVRGHAAGLAVFGATITPFCAPGFEAGVQPYSSEERERTRRRVNAWIRDGGWFDAVVDFDAVVRDPEVESQLAAEYDSGDYLHLNPKGYEAMAQAFPVGLFQEFAGGVDGWA